MNSEIKITLKLHLSYINNFISWTGAIVLFVWLIILCSVFSVGGLIGFLIVSGIFGYYWYYLHKHPAVITADSEKVVYTQLFSSTEILLNDIDRISCEPYVVNSRYYSAQHIRVTIYTRDDELELSDRVDTNALITDKLEDTETDIPLLRLYRFLMRETGRWK